MKVVSWASGAALTCLVLAAVPSSAGDEVALSRSGVVEALRLLVAMPGRDWIFSREPRPDAAAVAVAARKKP